MSYCPLVYAYRGQTLDLTHCGYVCIVDERSNVLYSAGDNDAMVFYRSASKPIQALPVIYRGLHTRYGLSDEETVIFSASHAGERFHVSAMESILQKAGFTENMLLMNPAKPSHTGSNEERIRLGLPPRKLYHNCSGKHIALMLIQRDLGGKSEDYWQLDSLATLEVKQAVMAMSETQEIKLGIDGCGVPVFAVPIRHMAAAFKNLACPSAIRDERLQAACAEYIPRIHKYPRMIRGTDTLCSVLNEDANIVAKDGANGVFGIGLRKQRLGVAFKMTDGTEAAWPSIVRQILGDLGCLSAHVAQRMDTLFPPVIHNDNGVEVGHMEAAFSVQI